MNSVEPQPPSPSAGLQAVEPGAPPRPADKYDAPSLVGNQGQKRFHVMAKPSGSTCNLDCRYCFYLSKETLPNGPGAGRMSDEVLEKFIQQCIAGVTGPEVVFSWQGGEPTLVGLDFFRKVVALQKQYGVPFNTLTCVNRFNARKPLDVYRFLRREIDSTYLQFIPIVEYRGFEKTAPHTWNNDALPRDGDPEARPGHPHSIVTDWSVDPDDWGYFLCKVFDDWRGKDLGKVMVNHFETLVAQHLGLGSQLCIYSEFCGKGVAIEHDGGVYSCDHYVYPEYRLGNIRDQRLDTQVFSRTQVKFVYAKNETLPKYCRACPFLSDCWGECPKNRIIRTPDGEPGLNYLCAASRHFSRTPFPRWTALSRTCGSNPCNPENGCDLFNLTIRCPSLTQSDHATDRKHRKPTKHHTDETK